MTSSLEKSPVLKNRPGLGNDHGQRSLKNSRRPQVHCAAIVEILTATASAPVAWTIYHTERRAEDIRVGNSPSRMVQNIVEAGEELQPHSLHNSEFLRDRVI